MASCRSSHNKEQFYSIKATKPSTVCTCELLKKVVLIISDAILNCCNLKLVSIIFEKPLWGKSIKDLCVYVRTSTNKRLSFRLLVFVGAWKLHGAKKKTRKFLSRYGYLSTVPRSQYLTRNLAVDLLK